MDTSQENWEELNKINLDLVGNIWGKRGGAEGGWREKGGRERRIGKGGRNKMEKGGEGGVENL